MRESVPNFNRSNGKGFPVLTVLHLGTLYLRTFLFEYLVGFEWRGTGWIKLDNLTKP